ncbi:MAG: restriction endonuclease subunit S [Methanococci archaeon]|nr:restriction endonuclease subunit S [Methanococci archaeon]
MFYKEGSFKKSEVGEIPEDWEVRVLNDVSKDILTGATPLRSKNEYWENGNIPWLTNEEVEDDKINYIYDTKQKITELALNKTNVKLIPTNSVILSLTASVGKVAINKIPITTNQQFNSFVVRENIIIPEFLAYYFLYSKKRIEMLGGKTTFKFISKSKISNFKIPLPPLEEQKQIAKILNDFDSLVETINKQIETLNKAKKGMMKKLFTKGVFEHKGFKKSEIGEIPEDWGVVEIKDVFDVKTGSTPSTKKSEYWENEEINWITPLDLSKLNEKIYIGYSERKITKIALEKCNLNLLPKGSIIISTRAPVGYVAVLTAESTFNQGCKGLVPKNNDLVNTEFYAYYLKFKKNLLENLSGGSTFKELSKSMLENFKIPLPPLEEQKAIAERLKAIDDLIEIKRKEKEQIEKAKKKVMELLLTGKVRVKNLNS